MDSGDEDPGRGGWVREEDFTLPQLTRSLEDKFSEYQELDEFQEGITNILDYLKRLLSDTIINTEASKDCESRSTKISEMMESMYFLFSFKEFRADTGHVDFLLRITKHLADKGQWYKPASVRDVRDKFYIECKRAVREFCKLIVRLPKESRPGPDYINWVFSNRLLKLVYEVFRIARKDVMREKRTVATELLVAILSWLQLEELKISQSKLEELLEDIFEIITLKKQTGYDIHLRQSVDSRALSIESLCSCHEGPIDKSLRETLSKLCARNPKIFKLTLAHALEEPEKIESSTTWAFSVLIEVLRQKGDEGWRQILSILDKSIAPRMRSDNSDIKTKAVWMINICIGDDPKHAQDLAKHLQVMLDFIHPVDSDTGSPNSGEKLAALRKLSQVCWFKVLILMGGTTLKSPDLEKVLFEKLCEDGNKTCALDDYSIKFRFSGHDKAYDLSFEVCLLATAILQLQLGGNSDSDTIAQELTDSIKKLSCARKVSSQSLLERLLGEISSYAAIYRNTPRLELIEKTACALNVDSDSPSHLGRRPSKVARIM